MSLTTLNLDQIDDNLMPNYSSIIVIQWFNIYGYINELVKFLQNTRAEMTQFGFHSNNPSTLNSKH